MKQFEPSSGNQAEREVSPALKGQSRTADSRVSHLGFIADGTRRWARAHGISLTDAYFAAVNKIGDLSAAAFDEGVEFLSLYMLSVENLRRDPSELQIVFNAEMHMFDHLLPQIASRWQCKMVHAGDSKLLPEAFAKSLERVCTNTKTNQHRVMYLCAGYDPHRDITRACELSQANGRTVMENLAVPRSVNFLIRTGQQSRLSNFLPLQCGYAELYFSDKLFPDFTPSDLKDAFRTFRASEKRYGR